MSFTSTMVTARFATRRRESIKHGSFAGMGVDIGDFNNDGQPDILQVDMFPAALESPQTNGRHRDVWQRS